MIYLLSKAHNGGYTKKDGTVVKPFDDKRLKAPQLGLFGGLWGGKSGKPSLFVKKPYTPPAGAVAHPQARNGKLWFINSPDSATDAATWHDPAQTAVFVPGGVVPAELGGVPLSPWVDAPTSDEDWEDVPGQIALEEPPMHLPIGKHAASGVVIMEDDGRAWLVSPTNGFGGYDNVFPKGTDEGEMSLQANAIKEAFEESGLQVEIVDLIDDVERTTSVTRYYLARRVGGTPADMGWESQAARLVPVADLKALLKPVDHTLVDLLAPEW